MSISAIQQLHDLEIQGAIGWPVDGKIIARIGCPLDDRFESEALVTSFAEAEAWFRQAAKVPEPSGSPEGLSIVDELFSAGVPATALWVYDGMFQAAFASPDDSRAVADWIGAESWAALEHQMRRAARHRPSKLPSESQPSFEPLPIEPRKRPFQNWRLTRGVPCVFTNTGKQPMAHGIYDENVNLIAVISVPPRTEIEIPALENYTGESSITYRPLPARAKAARKRK
jgi:hypothetical protein